MASITIRVRELFERVKDMRSDGCEYVEIDINDAADGEPAYIHFDCMKSSEPDAIIDYEDIDAVPKEYLP